jgi:Domain of unknown function DUF29
MIPKHDEDFYGWAIAEAQLLKEGKLNELDIENLIEELESMGASEKRALVSRLTQLLMHLLKWEIQTRLRGKSWEISIKKQRRGIKKIIQQNPSLKANINPCLTEAYEDAREDAADETGLDKKTFPTECPYTFEQVINDDFYPQ